MKKKILLFTIFAFLTCFGITNATSTKDYQIQLLSEEESFSEDISAVNNKDETIAIDYDYAADEDYLNIESQTSIVSRFLIDFTLPAGSGEINKIDLYVWCYGIAGGGVDAMDIHQTTRSNWVEGDANWTTYDGVNEWTTPGGDYNGTIIDSITNPTGGSWSIWTIQGDGADNPLDLTWGESVDLLIKAHTEETEARYYNAHRSSANANADLRPYLKITYSGGTPEPEATSTDEMLEKITSDDSTSTFFFINKSISYGDEIIISFLFLFLVFGILKFFIDWFIPKKLDWKQH